jgi:hypothetical protein
MDSGDGGGNAGPGPSRAVEESREQAAGDALLVEAAAALTRRASAAVTQAILTCRPDRDEDLTAIGASVRELRLALTAMMDERDRIEKLRQQSEGVVRDYALDFDRARLEIASRLDRIRAAGAGG